MQRSSRGPAPPQHVLRLSDLRGTPRHEIALDYDAEARAALAEALGIPGIRKLRFAGTLFAEGKRDWRLEADLGATVTQACVVTLDPVTTRIDEPVVRRYMADLPDLPEGDEIEMPEDDTIEPLPDRLDLGAVVAEALALALPQYPHVEGVDPLEANFTEPGKTAMTDDDARPFAGLAGLRDKLGGTED